MKKRRVGKSDIFITPYTLGCMSLGTDESHARSIIDSALDKGINHLDTADLYDFGTNENIVGKAVKGRRDELILTSKVGNQFDPISGDIAWNPKKSYIVEAVKDSLHRLQTDYIDIYLLHGGTIDDPKYETIEAFEQLKKEGLIRAYGLSSIRPNVIQYYVKHANIDVIMMQYSMLDRRCEEFLSWLVEEKISVLARGPLAKGILTDHGETVIHQKAQDGYLQYNQEELLHTIEQITKISDSPLAQTALQYVLHHPAVVSAVFGASKQRQIEELMQADHPFVNMPAHVFAAIQEITKADRYRAHRI